MLPVVEGMSAKLDAISAARAARPAKTMDTFSLFGQTISHELRALSSTDSNLIMYRVHTMLFEARAGVLQSPQLQPPHHYQPPQYQQPVPSNVPATPQASYPNQYPQPSTQYQQVLPPPASPQYPQTPSTPQAANHAQAADPQYADLSTPRTLTRSTFVPPRPAASGHRLSWDLSSHLESQP